MPKAKANMETKIGEAALQLAIKGWPRVTVEAVAKQAKIPLAQAKKLYPQPNDILPAIVGFVDMLVEKTVGKIDRRAPPPDRLFEILMVRFDVLQTYRVSILNIMETVRRDPSLIRKLLPAETKAMRQTLIMAGLAEKNPMQPIAIAGLLGVYGLTLCCWQQDEHPDMAKTMAALDRNLKRANKMAEIIFRAS